MKLLNQKQLATVLVALGVIPFLAFTAAIAGFDPLEFPAQPASMLHVYGVVIGTFVAGLHWGIHFCKRTQDSVYLYSSLITLLLWCSMWSIGSALGLMLVLLGFVLLWLVEYRFSAQRVTTAWFWKLRSAVSAIVVLCLGVAIVLL